MNIIINGTSRQLDRLQNLSDIVNTCCKQSKNVLAELNGNLIHRDQWAKTSLKDGDALELVAFVGGG